MEISENKVKKVIPLYYTIPLLFICVTILLLFIFIFNISTPVSLQPSILNYVNVSSCGVLTQDNTYYILNRSLNSSGTCIYLYAHNSILDGDYKYTITSTNSSNVSFAVENRGNGNIIQRLNVSSYYIGLYSYYNQGTKIIGNVIRDSNVGIRVVNSLNVSVIQNLVINHTWSGIDFWGSSGSGTSSADGIHKNFIQKTEYVQGTPGIYLNGSTNFNISSNFVGYSAKALHLEYSNGNVFTNNILRTGEYGIFSKNSNYNSFFNESIENFVNPISSFNSIFNLSKINIVSASASMNPMDIVDSGSTIYLIDTYLNVYNFDSTRIGFVNSGKGEILVYPNITINGNNLSSDVKINYNLVEVNSLGFNKPARIRLVNLPTTFSNATILRNGVPCPQSICVNLSNLNAGTVLFNVTSLGANYSIGNWSASLANPFITIESPGSNEVYLLDNSPLPFAFSLSQIGNMWFTLNNGTTNVTLVNNTHFTYNQSALPVGNYTMNVYANFSNTNFIANSTVKFRVVQTAGTVSMSIVEPSQNEIYYLNNFPVPFVGTISSSGKMWFTLNNGTTNVTMVNSSNTNTHFTYNQPPLPVGNYTMKVYANFTSYPQIEYTIVNFSVVNVPAQSPSGSLAIDIVEPDLNENYYLSNFPVSFVVSLNQTGKVWFTLNNGTTNVTMVNSSNTNTHFTYNQPPLPVGNYTMKVYANFTGTTQKATNYVNFKVKTDITPGPGSPPVNQTNTTSIGNLPSISSPPPQNLGNVPNEGINPEEDSGAMGSVVFWLIILTLIAAIGVLVFFIIQSLKSKKVNQVASNNKNYPNVVNRLR